MRVSELIAALKRHKAVCGDTYVSVRHAAGHEFEPNDDLMDIEAVTNSDNNLFTLRVEN